MTEADGREPASPEEWQDAVDAANALLVFTRAAKYGFITGGPNIRVERCEDLLRRGRALGYHPDREAVAILARGYATKGDEEALVKIALSVHDEIRDDPRIFPQPNPRALDTH